VYYWNKLSGNQSWEPPANLREAHQKLLTAKVEELKAEWAAKSQETDKKTEEEKKKIESLQQQVQQHALVQQQMLQQMLMHQQVYAQQQAQQMMQQMAMQQQKEQMAMQQQQYLLAQQQQVEQQSLAFSQQSREDSGANPYAQFQQQHSKQQEQQLEQQQLEQHQLLQQQHYYQQHPVPAAEQAQDSRAVFPLLLPSIREDPPSVETNPYLPQGSPHSNMMYDVRYGGHPRFEGELLYDG
jgi:hypothetical protein